MFFFFFFNLNLPAGNFMLIVALNTVGYVRSDYNNKKINKKILDAFGNKKYNIK